MHYYQFTVRELSVSLLALMVGAIVAWLQKRFRKLPESKFTRIFASLGVGVCIGFLSLVFLVFDEAKIVFGGGTIGYWLVAAFFRTDDS